MSKCVITSKMLEYLSVPAVVGNEQAFMDHLSNDFEALELQVYQSSGLLEVSGSKPYTTILSAHIDRHGLISIGDGEYAYAAQYMKEIKYGEPNRTSRRELQDIAARFEGEAMTAYDVKSGKSLGHGVIATCTKRFLNGDSLFNIKGMEDMPIGTPIAYASPADTENGYLRGQIDNTLCVAVIYALFKAGFQGTALLTTEEEIGYSWKHMAAHFAKYSVETRDLLILDTSPYIAHGPIEKGAIIFRNRDKSAVFNPDLTDRLRERCRNLGMIYECKDEVLYEQGSDTNDLGSTELGKLIKNTEGRWSGTTVQIPTIMYHTSHETTTIKAACHYYDFLKSVTVDDRIELDISCR